MILHLRVRTYDNVYCAYVDAFTWCPGQTEYFQIAWEVKVIVVKSEASLYAL